MNMTRFSYIKNRTLLIIASIIVVMTLNSCSNQDKPTVPPSVKVAVQVVGGDSLNNSGTLYSGTTLSSRSSTVSFLVPGTVTHVYTGVGNQVVKGQKLASLKSEDLVNANNIAQAELAEAQDAYRRLKKLHDSNALPDVKWVEIQSKLKQAENAAAIAQRAVGDATIYAPFAGYVSEKFADEGQTVIASQPIFSIVNVNDMQVSISVPESEIQKFGPDTRADVTLDGLDSLKLTGTFDQKGVLADPLTRSYTVKFNIPNPSGKILPGMIATVRIENKADGLSETGSTFNLPAQAVLLDSDNRQFVWAVRDGKTQRVFVKANELSSYGVTVSAGLSSGDSVIVAGMQKVSSGTKVTTM